MKKLTYILALFMLVCQAQAITRVQEVLYRADGGKVVGMVRVEWSTFTTGGRTVPGGFKDVTLRDGLLLVDLEPYTSYVARYKLGGADAFSEYWSVPVSATPVTVQSIRTSAIPQPGLTIALPALDSAGASINQVMTWNGSQWIPQDPSGGTGGSVPAGTVNGQALVWNGSLSQWKPQAVTYSFDFNVHAYTTGMVEVINGSATVKGIGTTWTPDMTGRILLSPGCNLGYLFTYVNATTGTLEAPYACPTVAGTLLKGTVAGPYTIEQGVNDQLLLSINGLADIPITLTAGVSRATTQVADEIRSALTTAGATASAIDDNGQVRLSTTNDIAGSSISIKNVSSSAYATLGFTVGTSTGGIGNNYFLNQVVDVPASAHNLNTDDFTVTCWGNSTVMPAQRTKLGQDAIAVQMIDTDTHMLRLAFYDDQTGRCVLQR